MWSDSRCLKCGSALVQVVVDWFDIVQQCFSVGSVVSGRFVFVGEVLLSVVFLLSGAGVSWIKSSFVCGAALDCFWIWFRFGAGVVQLHMASLWCSFDSALVQIWCSMVWQDVT